MNTSAPKPRRRAAKPARSARPSTNLRHKTAGQPARSPTIKLSRVTGPRRALRLIADSMGQVSGIPNRPHDPRDFQVAWMQLGEPVGGFVKSLIACGLSVPLIADSADEDTKMDELAAKAQRSPEVYVRAIWREAPIPASLAASTYLAHRIQRLFRGRIPSPQQTNGPAGADEWHVRDSLDRPVICRVLKRENGRLQILDAPGGYLHLDTLRLSSWWLCEGWLLPPGFSGRGRVGPDEGEPANPVPKPRPPV